MSKLVEVDTKTFVRFWLVIAGIVLVISFLYRARTGLMLVGLSVFLALALRPLVVKIQNIGKKRGRKGLNKSAAAGIAVGGVVLLFGVFFATVGPMVVNETAKFFSNAPELLESTGGLDTLNALGSRFGINNLSGEITVTVKNFSADIAKNLSSSVISSVSALANFLAGLVLVIVMTILCLIQGPDIANSFWEKIDGKNGKTGAVVRRIATRVANVISKYVSGQVTVALIDAVVVWVVTFIMSFIFGFSSGLAFPMAMIALLCVMIPMFGAIIAAVLVSLMVFFQNPAAGVAFLIFYVIYQQIESNVISPRIQANSLDLPSLAILVSVTIGMYMFGLAGAIISIPIAGIIKVFVEEYPAIKALEQGN